MLHHRRSMIYINESYMIFRNRLLFHLPIHLYDDFKESNRRLGRKTGQRTASKSPPMSSRTDRQEGKHKFIRCVKFWMQKRITCGSACQMINNTAHGVTASRAAFYIFRNGLVSEAIVEIVVNTPLVTRTFVRLHGMTRCLFPLNLLVIAMHTPFQ